jgi:small neutral amino acid transporter SnatA (MarC family)
MLGALIRITGLMVMTIGMQMALDGFAAWWAAPAP